MFIRKLKAHHSINKPGTAKVGAIYKAQNCKRGDHLGFVELQLVAKYEKNEGAGTLWCNPKKFKKSHSPEKNRSLEKSEKHQNSQKGILSMFSRFRTSVLFFLFVLTELLRFECFEPP